MSEATRSVQRRLAAQRGDPAPVFPVDESRRLAKKATVRKDPAEFVARIAVGQRFTINRVECVVTYVNSASGTFSARPAGSLGDKVRGRPGEPESRGQEVVR